jgi:hypothetical protein
MMMPDQKGRPSFVRRALWLLGVIMFVVVLGLHFVSQRYKIEVRTSGDSAISVGYGSVRMRLWISQAPASRLGLPTIECYTMRMPVLLSPRASFGPSPMYLSVPFWILGIALIIVLVLTVRGAWRRIVGCHKCGYDLVGLSVRRQESRRCPECGTVYCS